MSNTNANPFPLGGRDNPFPQPLLWAGILQENENHSLAPDRERERGDCGSLSTREP